MIPSPTLPMSPLSVVFTVAFLVVSYYLYLFLHHVILQPYIRHRQLNSQGLRSPSFKPLIGDLLLLRRYSDNYARLQFGDDNRRLYGRNFHFMLGPFNLLSLADPDYVLAAWKTQFQHYSKGVFTRTMLGSLVGMNSLVIIDNPTHSKHRKMIAPAFHYARLQQLIPIMIDESARKIDEVCQSFPPSSDPHLEVELHSFFIGLTFRIIMSSSFGNSLDTIPTASTVIHHALTVTLPIMQQRQLALIEYIPLLCHLPILGKVESERGKREMEDVVGQMVHQRRAGMSHSNCQGNDLLDILIQARDPETGEGFDDLQIRSDAMTFVLAGHETASSLMTFVMRDLCLRPELYRLCREEVEKVTGGGPLLAEHLPALAIIDACIHETFRLTPPVPGTSIQAIEDHWLKPEGRPPLFIPKGTNLGQDIYGLHTHPDLWDNPLQWDHERWIKGSATYQKLRHPVAFSGFSIGSRSCIGSQFALMESRAITAMLVRELDVEMVEGEKYNTITQQLTLTPAFGIRVKVRKNPLRSGKANAGAAAVDEAKQL